MICLQVFLNKPGHPFKKLFLYQSTLKKEDNYNSSSKEI